MADGLGRGSHLGCSARNLPLERVGALRQQRGAVGGRLEVAQAHQGG